MFDAIVCKLQAWWQRDAAIRKLGALDDRLLQDMGTSRKDIGRFVTAQEREERQKRPCPARHPDAVRFVLDA